MTTEQYSIGYDAGYQDGFDAALAEPVKQEPVAWYGLVMEAAAELELASYAIQQDSDSKRSELNAATWVREQAKKLRSANPPTAALAARQMRDAAVKILLKEAEFLESDNDGASGALRDVAKAIAALPVPDVQWRDLTDDEIKADFNATKYIYGDDGVKFARAVIAKFKEVNK